MITFSQRLVIAERFADYVKTVNKTSTFHIDTDH